MERVIFYALIDQFHLKHNNNYIKVYIFAVSNFKNVLIMGYRFIDSGVKYGISLDGKSFCVVSDKGIDIYNNVDEFLNAWRSYIEKYVLNK